MWAFWKSKTVWTAMITAATGLGFYIAGEMDFVELVKLESTCALFTCLRHGVSKAEL